MYTTDRDIPDYELAEMRDASLLPYTESRTSTAVSSVDLNAGEEIKGKLSAGESMCREVVRSLYPDACIRYNVRGLQDLTNPITNRALELDILLPDEKIAIEYNGAQHYGLGGLADSKDPTVLINRPGENTQQFRDQRKAEWCVRHGVLLITVPPLTRKEDIARYIMERVDI